MKPMFVCLAALVAAQLALAPAADDKSSFVTMLGRDTVVVESVVRASDRITGDIVVRVPSTVRLHYDVRLRPDGSAARATLDLDPMGAASIPARHVDIDFRADSAHVTVDVGNQRAKAVHAMTKGLAPMLMTGFDASYGLYSSMGLYELLLTRAKPSGGDTLKVASIDLFTGDVSQRKFLARSATTIDVDYFGIMWTHLTVDASGTITAADASGTTEKTMTQRVAWLDAAAVAKQFAAEDRSGKGVGAASPNLMEKSTIGGKPAIASYGSPRRRGRTILGVVVPYDRVWRTGANAATTLYIGAGMTFAGSPVPAGSYSLWTIPKADGTVTLIINGQHGQWGTNYDSTQDIVRVPMQVSSAPSPQENFAINIKDSGSGGELRVSWDTFVWSVPIVVQ